MCGCDLFECDLQMGGWVGRVGSWVGDAVILGARGCLPRRVMDNRALRRRRVAACRAAARRTQHLYRGGSDTLRQPQEDGTGGVPGEGRGGGRCAYSVAQGVKPIGFRRKGTTVGKQTQVWNPDTGPKAVRLPHSRSRGRVGGRAERWVVWKFYATFYVVSLGDLGTLLGAARRVASFAFGCTCD